MSMSIRERAELNQLIKRVEALEEQLSRPFASQLDSALGDLPRPGEAAAKEIKPQPNVGPVDLNPGDDPEIDAIVDNIESPDGDQPDVDEPSAEGADVDPSSGPNAGGSPLSPAEAENAITAARNS
tara:strand:+ start:1209 stop:1586 length:378 start_codon:yes stop_codon:yes gene_type:complete